MAPFPPNLVSAEQVTLSGVIEFQSGVGVVGATIDVVDPASGDVVAAATAVRNGRYTMSVEAGVYTVRVTPPPGSAGAAVELIGRSVTMSTTIDVVLPPEGDLTMSGRVTDALGDGVAGVSVHLDPVDGGPPSETVTDETGRYRVELIAVDYTMSFRCDACSPVSAIPSDLSLTTSSPIGVAMSTVIDLPVPAARLLVHVQDETALPVPGVEIAASGMLVDRGVIGGVSYSGDPRDSGRLSDDNGDAVLWLLPTDLGTTPDAYTIIATPPAGVGLSSARLDDIEVTGDRELLLTLGSAPTATATSTATGSPTPSDTPHPTSTSTSTSTSTIVALATETATPTSTATSSASPTVISAPPPTSTSASTATPSATTVPTNTPASTPSPTTPPTPATATGLDIDLTAPTGELLTAACFALYRAGDDGRRGPFAAASCDADKDGRTGFDDLSTGRYLIALAHPAAGHRFVDDVPIEIAGPGRVTLPIVSPPGGASVIVTSVTAAGQRWAEGCYGVFSTGPGGTDEPRLLESVCDGADWSNVFGDTEIDGLPAGHYRVRRFVDGQGYVAGEPELQFEISADEHDVVLTYVIGAPGDATATIAPTSAATPTATPPATATATQTLPPTATATPTSPSTATATGTTTTTPTATATAPETNTATATTAATATATMTSTAVPTSTATITSTPTPVPSTPRIALSKTKSKFNGSVEASLSGFAPNSMVTLSWPDGTAIATASVSGAGTGWASFRTPLVPLGTYPVEARDPTGRVATAPLSVIPRIMLNEETGPVTTRLRVYLYGFAPGERVEVRWYATNGMSYLVVKTVAIASNGRGSSLITIPAATGAGKHKVMGRVIGVARSGSTTFQVTTRAGETKLTEPTASATVTMTPTVTETGTATSADPAPTLTPTPTPDPATPPTIEPTATATSTPEPTATPTPEPTATPEPTLAPTPEPTPAPTPDPAATNVTEPPDGASV